MASSWPTTTTGALSSSLPMPSNGGLGDESGHHGGHRGGDGGDTLQEWSSLIGIITAIVGNVLIALALNVQRYAHTRLHKERKLVRLKAHAALKRAQSIGAEPGTYGTIIDRPGDDGIEDHINNSNNNRNGNGDGNGNAIEHIQSQSDENLENDREYREDDPLAASFQSTSSSRGDDSEAHSPKPTMSYLKSPYWWLGQILITLGEMGNFLAYGFAPASIVSPLGVVALISNCIIAPAMFHEKFRVRDFWGVLIAVAGVVVVVWSANQEETKLGPNDVWGAITTLEFEIYMGVTSLLIIALMWASTRYGKRTILIDLGLVGLFGGYTALSTKGVSSMLSSTLWGAFKTPVTYALLFVLLVTAIMQIRYVNKALQRFDSTEVIPIQFVMFTLCVIIGSAVLYRDFEKTTLEQAGKFIGGCLLTFFGVFLITTGREKRADDDEDLLSEADGIEETIGLSQHDGTLSFPPYQDDPSQRPCCSRRSSKLPRLGLVETPNAEPYRDDDANVGRDPAMLYAQAAVPERIDALVSNPWSSSWEVSSAPARGMRTISTESVATRSALGLMPTHSHSTMPRSSRDHHQRSFSTDRPVTSRGHSYKSSVHHHRPRTFISPSPLSSTFTTVVKDAFLREGELSAANKSSNRRTLRSSIRASLFFDEEERDGIDGPTTTEHEVIPESDEHQARSSRDGPFEGDETTRRRSRSLSDAIGDFFRLKKDVKESGMGSEEARP